MKKIGIFMGDITQDYQSVVIKAIFDEANKMGYTAFCFANFGAYGNKILYAEGERGVVYLPDLAELDGIIVGEDTFDVPGMENEVYEYLKKNAKCPVIYLRTVRQKFYRVIMDESEAIRSMVRHFTDFHGFRDICFMTGTFDRLDARKRYQGYIDAMANHGLPVGTELVEEADYSRESSYAAAQRLLSLTNRPSALFCMDDYKAVSALSVAMAMHLRVPEDISIMGHNDYKISTLVYPALTTVHVPLYHLGSNAADLVVQAIRRPEEPIKNILLPSHIVERDSVASLPRQ